jgi:chaperonin GroEL
MAKLSGGVAVIKVGAASEAELNYMKAKMEDALSATRAAVEEGIVAGGGTALAKAACQLFSKENSFENNEYRAGYETLVKALSEPLKQIVSNAGNRESSVVLNKIITEKNINYGYDARQDKFETDMIKAGIIDPLKVTRTALENAVSVASMLLTTEAAITDKPEEKNTCSHGGGMPGMGGMGGMM